MITFDSARRELLKLTAVTGSALAAGPFLPGASPEATAQPGGAVGAPISVALRVKGPSTGSHSIRAPRCSTRCASTCNLLARRRAAASVSAAPARC